MINWMGQNFEGLISPFKMSRVEKILKPSKSSYFCGVRNEKKYIYDENISSFTVLS